MKEQRGSRSDKPVRRQVYIEWMLNGGSRLQGGVGRPLLVLPIAAIWIPIVDDVPLQAFVPVGRQRGGRPTPYLG